MDNRELARSLDQEKNVIAIATPGNGANAPAVQGMPTA